MPTLAFRALTPKPTDQLIIDRVAEAVRKGHPLQTAGRLAGIGGSTASMWLLKGTEEVAAGEQGSHVAFAEAVKQAEAELVDSMLTHIQDAAESDHKHWPAAMTLLERRFPADFGRNQRIEIEQNVTITHRVELGTALQSVLDMIVELESVDSPQQQNLLPEATSST